MTYQHEQAVKALQLQAQRARELADKLDQYAQELQDDREVKLTDRFSWAINEVENFIRNVNFSQLARHMMNLAK